MNRRSLMTGGAAALAAAALPARAVERVSAEARRLYQNALVIDGNLVAPLDITGPLDATLRAQVKASGLSAFKMTLGGPGSQTRDQTTEECGHIDKAISLNPDLFTKVRKIGDITAARDKGLIGLIASFEAGEMLEGQLDSIDHFRALDVLVMGLSYNLTTPFGSGVMSKTPTGLTELGRQAIHRMNTLGVTLDISHSDETTGLAAIEATRRPVLVTHAGSGAIRPHPRNKSDRLMRALAGRGGVIGIFDLSYISVAPEQPSLAAYMGHLTHALKVAGEDHVGIGSDTILTPFDTSPEMMKMWDAQTASRKAAGVAAPGEGPPPFVTGLNRSDRCVVIADRLLKAGYPARVAEKVLGLNFHRVFAETWSVA